MNITRLLTAFAAAFALFAAGPAQAAPKLETAWFAGGCFWCLEKDMEKIPGVVDAVSGYAGGDMRNPTYENHEGHREAVKVTYDPAKISYRQLVDRFWPLVDVTDAGGQFCDRGYQYSTAVWVANEAQRQAAEASKAVAATRLKGRRIVTPVERYSSFWLAEGYHQDYAKKNPVRYRFYRQTCGRDARVKAIWGR
jgi:peptide-methionine (S)-S-oxide reductase